MSRYTPQDAANAAAATQAHMRQQQAQAQASNGTSASIHSGQTNNTNSSSSSSSNRYNGSSGSASNSGSGSGANTALLSGIVMGNANGAGASASVPSATRDVLSGGIGAEYGPYSHIRGGSSSAASPRGTTATYRNAAGGGGPFRGAAAGNNGGGSSGETGSGGSSGSIASSHHSSSGLLGAEYTNKSLAGPHSGGGAYSRGAAGATAGPGAGFDKRSSAHSTAYSDANSSSQQQGRYLAPAGAGASGLLWDGKDPEVDDYLVSIPLSFFCCWMYADERRLFVLLLAQPGSETRLESRPLLRRLVHTRNPQRRRIDRARLRSPNPLCRLPDHQPLRAHFCRYAWWF